MKFDASFVKNLKCLFIPGCCYSFVFFFFLELFYINRISKSNEAKRKLFNQLNMSNTYSMYNVILNWIGDTLWIKKRKRTKIENLAVVQKRECQIHTQRLRLGHLGWNTWFTYKRKWQHTSSFSYQFCSPFGHLLPAKSSARFFKWIFYAHYIYFLSTYFPLPPTTPCNLLSISNNVPSLCL